MRRPVRLLLLVVFGSLPILVIAGADLPLVPFAEGRFERAAPSFEAASLDVELEDFPVVARALALGEVASVDYLWRGVTVGELRAASLSIRLDGVGLDRGALLDGRVRIDGIEAGELEIVVPPFELARLLDREVRFELGRLLVTLTPNTEVAASVSATAHGLVVSAGSLAPVAVDLESARIPCAPSTAIKRGNLVLRCTFRGLPPLLRS